MAGLKIGDKVTLTSRRPSHWNKKGEMDHLLGKEVTLSYISDYGSGHGVFRVEGEKWQFLMEDILSPDFNVGDEVSLLKEFKVFRVINNNMIDICDNKGNCMLVQSTEIFKIDKTQQMKAMKDAVLAVAKNLLKANNKVTTLEIKNELRRDYPYYFWTQDVVSTFMSQLAGDGIFDYTDNGTFREYRHAGTLANPVSSKPATMTGALKNTGISYAFGKVGGKTPTVPVKTGKRGRPRKTTSTVLNKVQAQALARLAGFQSVTVNGKVITDAQIRAWKKSPKGYLTNSKMHKVTEIKVSGITYQVK